MSGHGAEVPEDANDPFTRTVALAVAVFAVGLAIASFGGKGVGDDILLTKQEEARVENVALQTEAAEWQQFQSKSTREAGYRIQKELLLAEKDGTGREFPAYKDKLLDKLSAEEKRMRDDKEALKNRAEQIKATGAEKVAGLREELAKFQRQAPYFDFAEVGYQLALVLASIAILGKKWWPFLVSVVLAVFAIVLTVNGFFLLVAIPGIDPGTGGH
jgi:hypothetical protein